MRPIKVRLSDEEIASITGGKLRELPYMPCYERMIVWQVEEVEVKTEGGLYIPEDVKESMDRASCVGIILAAGVKAVEHLHSHGMEVGDTVWFSVGMITRHQGPFENGKRVDIPFIRSAAVAGAMEVVERMKDGTITPVYDEETGEVLYQWRGEKLARPEESPDWTDNEMGL